MAIDTVVQTEDYLKYFSGGKTGVQQRFGEAICEGLKKHSAYDFLRRVNQPDLDLELPKVFAAIVRGDYTGVTHSLIMEFQDGLDLRLMQLLGEPSWGEDREKLARKAIEGWLPVSSTPAETNSSNISNGDLRRYLILQALDQL